MPFSPLFLLRPQAVPPGGGVPWRDRVGSFMGRRRDHSLGGDAVRRPFILVSFSILILSSFFFFCARRLFRQGASLVGIAAPDGEGVRSPYDCLRCGTRLRWTARVR